MATIQPRLVLRVTYAFKRTHYNLDRRIFTFADALEYHHRAEAIGRPSFSASYRREISPDEKYRANVQYSSWSLYRDILLTYTRRRRVVLKIIVNKFFCYLCNFQQNNFLILKIEYKLCVKLDNALLSDFSIESLILIGD